MAEQFSYGVDGAVYLGGDKANYLTGWSMSVNTGVMDTPDLGSSGPKRTYAKYSDFGGSLNGQYQFVTPTTGTDTLAVQENITLQFVSGGTPAKVYAKFIESSKSMYHGNVVLSNISKNQPAEGVQGWSADWAQADGPLKHTTSTST